MRIRVTTDDVVELPVDADNWAVLRPSLGVVLRRIYGHVAADHPGQRHFDRIVVELDLQDAEHHTVATGDWELADDQEPLGWPRLDPVGFAAAVTQSHMGRAGRVDVALQVLLAHIRAQVDAAR
ncbi:MAG: hypothetical protein RLZZ297_1869 [Chloroflexota bacterium]|jgi:hypothetical protein